MSKNTQIFHLIKLSTACLLFITLIYYLICQAYHHYEHIKVTASTQQNPSRLLYKPKRTTSVHKKYKIKPYNKLFTDHIYIISQPFSKNERSRSQTLVDYLGLDVEYFKGLDKLTEGNALKKEKMYLTESLVLVAQWKTHIKLWSDMLRNGYETAFIIEDDWDVQSDIYSLIRKGLNIINSKNTTFIGGNNNIGISSNSYFPVRIPFINTNPNPKVNRWHNNWDIFFVGHCSASEGKSAPLNPTFPYLRKSQNARCINGYIISKSGAQKFIHLYSKDLEKPLGKLIGEHIREGLVCAYSFYPAVITQRRDLVKPHFGVNGFLVAPQNSLFNHISKFGYVYNRKDIINMGLY